MLYFAKRQKKKKKIHTHLLLHSRIVISLYHSQIILQRRNQNFEDSSFGKQGIKNFFNIKN